MKTNADGFVKWPSQHQPENAPEMMAPLVVVNCPGVPEIGALPLLNEMVSEEPVGIGSALDRNDRLAL